MASGHNKDTHRGQSRLGLERCLESGEAEIRLRLLDVLVAREVLGLPVLGWAPAWAPDGPPWTVVPGRHQEALHPVWIARGCHCSGSLELEIERLCAVASEEGWDSDSRDWAIQRERSNWLYGHNRLCLDILPFYSARREDASRILDAVRSAGLQEPFLRGLLRHVVPGAAVPDAADPLTLRADLVFPLLGASPEAICRAALDAFRLSSRGGA